MLLIPLRGTVSRTASHPRGLSLTPGRQESALWKSLRARIDRGIEQFGARRYTSAIQVFDSVNREARAARMLDLAARACGNSAGGYFVLHQYHQALQKYLEARRLAERAGDASEIAILDTNIASLYSQMGDVETAASWMQGALERVSGRDEAFRPAVLLQLATLRARQDRIPEALALFQRGIAGADRAGNLNLYTLGWNRVGEEYLKKGNLDAAESALLEAYRVRKLNGLPLDSSYRNLGRLRLLQGDLVSASHLLDRYVELVEDPRGGALPAWDGYQSRGQVHLAQGRWREALQDFRTALPLARVWRRSVPPQDAFRIGTEGMLDPVYAGLIEAGNRLYLETHAAKLIRETFEAVEENRAGSLLAMLADPQRERPPAYWEAVLSLSSAETQALRSGRKADQAALAAARAEVLRLETAESPGSLPTEYPGLLSRVQAALDETSVLLSLQLGNTISWLWAVDRSSLALYALPPRRQIEGQARTAIQALADDQSDSSRPLAALYRTLFGPLAPCFRDKSRWLVALDQGEHSALADSSDEPGLFDAPLSALVMESARTGPIFAVEHHSTLVIPGAAYWANSAAGRPAEPDAVVFVGVGDAIYNSADPRLTVRHPGAKALPRLVASGAELDACARAWQGENVLLKGAEATRAGLEQQLRRHPAVLHFATHILPSTNGRVSGTIALSLDRGGETELLRPDEIAHWKLRTPLVVLSGCHSAQGAVLPGTGLLGLTRAWLAAGARSVIASHWNTPDESGALFSALYRSLRGPDGPHAAEALRRAQVEMIHAGGWRARPRYWGAYAVLGGE